MQRFSFKSGHAMQFAKLIKARLVYSATVRISTVIKKHFMTKILEYKVGLNRRIKFVCVAMCSLVMRLRSRDLHMASLNNITIH